MSQKSEPKTTKTCFVIMPITDMPGYDPGHFNRVYEHLIKPTILSAGYTPLRADEVKKTNYIVVDILRSILSADLALCDLSGRNPNVLFELGIRQSFNLPCVLIKDVSTERIFDIQGLRYTEYDQTLRVDSVKKSLQEMVKSIKETAAATSEDVNSLISLLGVQPAKLPARKNLSEEGSLIISALTDLRKRISDLEARLTSPRDPLMEKALQTFRNTTEAPKFKVGTTLYIDGREVGDVIDVHQDSIFLQTPKGEIRQIQNDSEEFEKLDEIPF